MKKLFVAWAFFCAGLVAFALSARAETEWIQAEIKKVDSVRLRIVLNHKRINSISMESMTMPFDVSKDVALEKVQAGEKVRVQVIAKDGSLEVTAMEKRQ